jgi:hypothetical protein
MSRPAEQLWLFLPKKKKPDVSTQLTCYSNAGSEIL